MRRLVIALVFLAGLAAPAVAKPYATPHAPQPGAANSDQGWQPPPKPSEDQQLREMQQQAQEQTGRSGFWTSPYPAKHGAYRWRLLGLGCATVMVMGLVILRLVRR